jgi:Zn ribbon nucleic-acid-binding protein
MAYPKMKPCPYCEKTDTLDVYTYDSGSRRVECLPACGYMGPVCISIRWAIRHHNSERDERASARRAALASASGAVIASSAATATGAADGAGGAARNGSGTATVNGAVNGPDRVTGEAG